MSNAYYDFRACLMDTNTPFRETPKVDAYGRPWPSSPRDFIVDDAETDKRYRLEGIFFGEALDAADLQAMVNEFFYAGASGAVTVEVSDNGRDGDGLWLALNVAEREGNAESHPRKWGTARTNSAPTPLVAVRLTARQAGVLGAALTAAAALYVAQGDEQ